MSVQSNADLKPPMLDTPTPIEVLADELGAVAGRIEREVRSLVALELEKLRSSYAEAQLRISYLERSLAEKMASIKDGEDGAPGKDGVNGKDGAPGRDGENGKDGVPGKDGENGKDGAPGKDGVDGKDGAPGKDGVDGAKGVDGKDGERGPEGPPGQLPVVKEYVSGEVYYQGDVVTSYQGTFQARKDTAQSLDNERDWVCLAKRGKDGRSMSIKGLYEEGLKYFALDIVSLNGGSFVALKDDPGVCPGEGWQLMAKQGKRGEPGPRGERGERGEKGLDAVGIAGWKREGYVAVPVMTDGSEGPKLDLRSFFEWYHQEIQ